jgi:hypothetical protein
VRQKCDFDSLGGFEFWVNLVGNSGAVGLFLVDFVSRCGDRQLQNLARWEARAKFLSSPVGLFCFSAAPRLSYIFLNLSFTHFLEAN